MISIDLKSLLDCTLALIALINPVSKIFIINTLSDKYDTRELKHISIKASLVAIIILIFFTLIGNILLKKFFHINIYSFQIGGGMVLLYRGFLALNKGVFFEVNMKQKLEDMSIVPLASPMIAGPATITASVSFPYKYGIMITLIAMIISVIINLIIMIYSDFIGKFFIKYNFMGALIRITGLIVATIGIQMILDGMAEYIKTLQLL